MMYVKSHNLNDADHAALIMNTTLIMKTLTKAFIRLRFASPTKPETSSANIMSSLPLHSKRMNKLEKFINS